MMKASIIMATFNSEKYLKETLLSIFSQIYSNIESIVIDGNSTDGTLSILQKYQNKIAYKSESDSGIYDAMNKGIEVAKGDIIGILKSDDVLFDKEIINNAVLLLLEKFNSGMEAFTKSLIFSVMIAKFSSLYFLFNSTT